jgi:TRAP-type uncharacterized transport system substrate-binding protein
MADYPRRHALGWRPLRIINYCIYALAILFIAIAVYRAIPPSQITIGTGPIGGSYYEDALKYKRDLASHGIKVNLKPIPDSLDIVNYVETGQNGVSIGFTAQRINPADYPNTRSLGAVELQPLFIFASARLGTLDTPDRLRGHRIVMPPERSATAQAALDLLARYDVSPANTSIAFLPIAQAVNQLQKGTYDAGFFMLDPEDGFITTLVADPGLRLIDLRDSVTLSRLDPYLRPIVLPHGVYDLEKDIPPYDVHMLAATVNVVARKDVPAAILYPMFDAMADTHHGSSLINNAGMFPNLIDISLPAHWLATGYQKDGMPWTYRYLPRWMASLVDSYLIIGLVLVAVAEMWSSVVYLTELIDLLFVHFWLRILLQIEHRVHTGRGLGSFHLKLVDIAENALLRSDRRRRSEELIGRIRAGHRG